ncbi:hypothetical protein ACFSVJ_13685 [Prauserella oleivorans]
MNRGGGHTLVHGEGLTMPGGLALRHGSAYISNCGVCVGDGSVLKVPLHR